MFTLLKHNAKEYKRIRTRIERHEIKTRSNFIELFSSTFESKCLIKQQKRNTYQQIGVLNNSRYMELLKHKCNSA